MLLKEETTKDGAISCIFTSSNIAKAMYKDNTLLIFFIRKGRGNIYEFKNINEKTFNLFKDSSSQGKFFNSEFKDLKATVKASLTRQDILRIELEQRKLMKT